MRAIINYAISHARLTIALLLFLLVAGFVAYSTIPKEAEPDVRIPIIYVQMSQRGISPEDAERLLLRPVETQLKSVANVTRRDICAMLELAAAINLRPRVRQYGLHEAGRALFAIKRGDIEESAVLIP